MLTIEHLNFFVKDLDKTLAFYSALAPHWKIRAKGAADWYGTPRNWIHFGDDTTYLAFSDSGRGEPRDLTSNQIGVCHFAFTTTNINNAIQRLEQAGFEIRSDGNPHPFRTNVYFLDPDGVEVELVEYQSDDPQIRNSDA